jgi:hypothetical protein
MGFLYCVQTAAVLVTTVIKLIMLPFVMSDHHVLHHIKYGLATVYVVVKSTNSPLKIKGEAYYAHITCRGDK